MGAQVSNIHGSLGKFSRLNFSRGEFIEIMVGTYPTFGLLRVLPFQFPSTFVNVESLNTFNTYQVLEPMARVW
jgi:hypothetical protein